MNNTDPGVSDHALVESLLRRYRGTFRLEHYSGMWRKFFERHHRQLHEVFMSGTVEQAAAALRDPMSNMLHYGFENTFKGVVGHSNQDLGELRQLSVALGADRLENPANPKSPPARLLHFVDRKLEVAEDVLRRIDGVVGYVVDFPNIFRGEAGTITARGVAGYRAIHAIYQAAMLRRGSVLEIGGGLGRTAYYAARSGIEDYTIVDLPFTAISQGYFLGRALGEHRISLLSPDEFLQGSRTYDICLNVDSMTEMGREMAERYASAIRTRCKEFISINQEANEFSVSDLFGRPASRHQYWLRSGYVEERFRFEGG
jgi:hypothetical protein